ncbi:MAG: AI-2E family transporter [Deltaproteobacteria bacterium]|nr:AI-2E family transporter [Deltaproteobacteria bacterium]
MKSEYLLSILLSVLIGYLMYVVMVPFLIPIFWAIVLVILFHPYYDWLLKKVRNRKALASILACLSIALFIIVPMAILGTALAAELVNVYQWAENYMAEISTRAHRSPLFLFPSLERFLEQYIDISTFNIRSIFVSSIRDIASFAGEGMKGVITSSFTFFFHLILAFFSMYFLFKDGDKLFNLIKDLIPLSERNKQDIITKNRAVVFSTIYGGVLVGIVQGALGGLAFWYLELPAPLLWACVMFLFSFLPSVGSGMIWAPAAVYLLIKGNIVGGVSLVLWGTFVIGLVDNILRPYIVSGKTDLHPLLTFFSILGAVNAFGFIGIIAGPLILSIGQATIELYHDYIKNKNTWAG